MKELNCLFCKIIDGNIPSTKVYEDENMLIIKDIEPKAPIHFLLLLKNHYARLEEQSISDCEILAKCLNKVSKMQKELGLLDGYRLIINQGENAGQSVQHIHVHILSGKKMDWNPA